MTPDQKHHLVDYYLLSAALKQRLDHGHGALDGLNPADVDQFLTVCRARLHAMIDEHCNSGTNIDSTVARNLKRNKTAPLKDLS